MTTTTTRDCAIGHTPYDATFYEALGAGSLSAARVILPHVVDLLSPRSVIDVGCGRGTWLKACNELGVSDILGIDGAYVDRSTLMIEPSKFQAHDLRRPLTLGRHADLVMCLEVAEHLPISVAEPLVRSLTSLAPCVLFSAAIPNQGGTHHVNEQWPTFWEYFFSQCGYRRLDAIRRHIFQDIRVPWWYQQNIVLYASDAAIAGSELLQQELASTKQQNTEVVARHVLKRYQSLNGLIEQALTLIVNGAKRRLARCGSFLARPY